MLCIHKIIVTGCMSFFTAKAFLRRKCEVTSQFRRPNCASKSTPAWDQKGPRCNQRATAIFFPHFSAVFSGFLSILIPFLTSCARILMCSAPVCGILCGQKQSLAGAIPAGLRRILRILLFHSMNNTKTVPGAPHEVGCHNQRKQPARRGIFREDRSWRKGGCGVKRTPPYHTITLKL